MAPQQQLMNNLQQLKNMMNLVKTSNQPPQMLQNILMQNPNINQVMSLIKQYGGNTEQAFYALAKEKGIDPQAILKALQ